MLMVRARGILPALVAAAVLPGCGISRLNESPSKTVDMNGSWVLDRAASDDPKPVLDKLRPKPVSRGWGAPPPDDSMVDDTGPPGGQQGGQGGGGRGRRGGGGQGQPPVIYRNSNDAYVHTTVIRMLQADLARAGYLTIKQSEDRFSIDYGSAVRSFTPGSISVVSAAWGVADQSSGWKGKDFVIQVKPQTGVASYERYSLSEDGQRLTEELQLGGGDFPSAKLKRVYDRTDKPVPRSVPNND
ncbi:MAG: hypothetical protein JSR66_06990 [Proteobacteria bacterium]|nr:hypothetical protein [Pseudomonadota bacterium]